MTGYHLAQLNIALMKAPLESPLMADFVANIDRINALAEAAPGFIWRLQSEDADATAFRPWGEEMLVNLSLWQDVESLQRYVFNSPHVEIMRRRREWFERMTDAHTVLWWVPQGHLPTPQEAAFRLQTLHRDGPSAAAFGFSQACPAPTSASDTAPAAMEPLEAPR